MLGFWEALEGAAKAPVPFDTTRRDRSEEARSNARDFYDVMLRDGLRLAELGLELTVQDRTVSFRRNGYSIVTVDFGVDDGSRNRIVSAIAVHLKLDPSYEDVASDVDIGATAGRWLGISMDLIAKNPEVFSRFGLA